MKFSAWAAFAAVWALLVYFPAAHAVFSFDTESGHRGGIVANVIGAVDFAGGTAIHINAGVGALALALLLVLMIAWPVGLVLWAGSKIDHVAALWVADPSRRA